MECLLVKVGMGLACTLSCRLSHLGGVYLGFERILCLDLHSSLIRYHHIQEIYPANCDF